jgi:hypothetical protein
MTARWYAVTDHVGSIYDLAGQEVVIAAVRMLGDTWPGAPDVHATMAPIARGRAWCRVFPTGSQVPTRGGIMRVRTAQGVGTVYADMLSAEQLIERLKADREAATEALRMVMGERDHLRGEVQRWRERAMDRDGWVGPACMQGPDDALASGCEP